ncbi:hypothetical protein SNE40_011851 [Patella caerulea]|uniref:NAD-capped RNA hydrolase NUDT12 n=2 Tax=Patella caerulea TaxID=87958 RepID=A0AAN8PUT1_PATCE
MLVRSLFRCSLAVTRSFIRMSSEDQDGKFQEVVKYNIAEADSEIPTQPAVLDIKLQMTNSSTENKLDPDSIKSDVTSLDKLNQLETRLFKCAAAGNVEEVTSILKIKGANKSVNWKNDRGWTALMLAARNNHVAVVKMLLAEGTDVNIMNSSGQTALDVATFWNNQEIVDLLTGKSRLEERQQFYNFFSQNPLYRASEKRNDKAWLQNVLKLSTTNFVIFSELNAFVTPVKNAGSEKKRSGFNLGLFQYKHLAEILAKKPLVVFLGLETWDPKSVAWFAVDVTGEEENLFKNVHEDGQFIEGFPLALQMMKTDAGIYAEARSILAWHDRYQFCPTCGSSTVVAEAGYKRECENKDCRSRKGIHNTNHPRVDPSMIMLVVSPEGKRCLLGRKKSFPPKMYSCLAGYMEPGESIEAACQREVEEESGIKVGHIEYHSSQPWPFPAVIMLGCIAHAKTDNIKIDPDELEDVRWFTKQDVQSMANRTHPLEFFFPPAQAIAHQLIKTWINPTSNL